MKKITKKKTVKKAVKKKATKKVAKKAVKKASKKVAKKKKKATKKTKKVVKSKSEQRRLAVQNPSTVVANEVPAYTKDGYQIGEDLSSLDQPSL